MAARRITDQVYYAAAADNALVDRAALDGRVAAAVAEEATSNERLRIVIDRIRLVASRAIML